MRAGWITALALSTACLSDAPYACEDDLQCVAPDRAGVCATAGWCAYPEPECRSGLRYSPHAEGGLAGACVPSDGASSDDGAATDGATTTDATTSGICDGCGTSSGGESSTGPDCESTCMAGPNATAECTPEGECVITCVDPWQDCDLDPLDGCEVPVGVTAQCSMAGLDPEGCWTPYCGESTAANAVNFGTYHCVSCATCREPEADTCSWCDQATGQWYPTDPGCACGSYLGAVCTADPP